MKYLISIPHQMPAFVQSFSNDVDILNYANAKCNDEHFETVEDAREWLTHDLHSGIWIESASDLEYALSYKGHQQYNVQAIAEEINATNIF